MIGVGLSLNGVHSMIIQDKTMKYDKAKQQYYLTPTAIVQELPVSDQDLKETFGDDNDLVEREIKYLCQRVYNFMFANNHPENVEWIKYKIYANQNNERYFLKEAMKAFVMGAFESDKDRNAYVNDKKSYPDEVLWNLQTSKLVGMGKYRGKIPEGDY